MPRARPSTGEYPDNWKEIAEWLVKKIEGGWFRTHEEFETTIQNIFSIVTFIYYIALASVIMAWITSRG